MKAHYNINLVEDSCTIQGEVLISDYRTMFHKGATLNLSFKARGFMDLREG